jgi:hypothetical protein
MTVIWSPTSDDDSGGLGGIAAALGVGDGDDDDDEEGDAGGWSPFPEALELVGAESSASFAFVLHRVL